MTGVRILVDADACPVKDEIYRVAFRHEVPVAIVSNSRLRVPEHPLIERVIVSATASTPPTTGSPSAADARAIVVTADILLADRCLKAGATRDRADRQALHDQLDRRRGRHPRDHGRPARRDGRRHRRPGPLRQSRPLALPLRRWTRRWCE